MNTDWQKKLNELVAAVKNGSEAGELLKALLTPVEYDEMAKRWQIVCSLMEGMPQRDISSKLGVSIATVTRGSREVKYGNGIFKKIYRRIKNS